MKIAFVTTGNVDKIATMKRAIGLAEPLVEMGHQVTIIALDCEANNVRFQLECPGAEIAYYDPSSALREVYSKNRILRQIQPDFVYACGMVLRNYTFPWLFGYRGVIVAEHSELISGIADKSRIRQIVFKMLERTAGWFYDGQVCASRYLERHFKSIVGKANEDKIYYSPYAYSHSLMFMPHEKMAEIAQTYRGKKVILYMGSLVINYGFLEIIKAMKNIKDDNIMLLIMGNGRHKQHGIDLVRDENLGHKVKFLGYVPEELLSSYFAIADSFVSPIFNTVQDLARCPSKLFMYLPFKKPVVTCNLGEAHELFGDDYAFYFDPYDSEGMADTLQRSVMPCDSLKWNPEDHEWHARAKGLMEWYDQTFAKKQ